MNLALLVDREGRQVETPSASTKRSATVIAAACSAHIGD